MLLLIIHPQLDLAMDHVLVLKNKIYQLDHATVIQSDTASFILLRVIISNFIGSIHEWGLIGVRPHKQYKSGLYGMLGTELDGHKRQYKLRYN